MWLYLPLSLTLDFKLAPTISTCGIHIPCFDEKMPWNLSRAEKAPAWTKATSSGTHFVSVKIHSGCPAYPAYHLRNVLTI